MNTVNTEYGTLTGILRHDTYIDGKVYDLELSEKNEILTPYGTFVPKYTTKEMTDRMHKQRSSISFYENGVVKSIALEKQMTVYTPFGDVKAELVTFYDDGKIKRVFPRNGQINGYWTEEDEGKLVDDYEFNFGFGQFKAKIIGLYFYRSGLIKSVTLWPGEKVRLSTPLGEMDVRIGFSLHENGNLKSIEPATQLQIETPIGRIWSFDYDAIGIHADHNSVRFNDHGELIGLKTSANSVRVIGDGEKDFIIEPKEVESYVDMSETTLIPLEILFRNKTITFNNGRIINFPLEGYSYQVERFNRLDIGRCGSCSSCGA